MAEKVSFYSDASASEILGFGCIFNQEWFSMQWEDNFIRKNTPSIQFLELYALCVGIFTWSHKLKSRRFTVFCDNLASVNMINGITSGCKYCMTLIRKVTLRALEFNFRLFACHIEGKKNILSDRLSRLKLLELKAEARKAKHRINKLPIKISDELWPLLRYWLENCMVLN